MMPRNRTLPCLLLMACAACAPEQILAPEPAALNPDQSVAAATEAVALADVPAPAEARPQTILIRCTGRIRPRETGSPLYIIDGVAHDSISSAHLNAGDIDSIEIIKSATASAMFGSRAANGIILITTRRPTGRGAGNRRG